jgi:hypothetical protein
LRAVEEENDRAVAALFGLTEEELEDVKEALRRVYGEGAEAGEGSEEEAAEVNHEEMPMRGVGKSF